MDNLLVRLALGVALFSGAFAQIRAQSPTCTANVEKPIYPPLARAASVYGVVKVDLQIGQDGRPSDVVLDGNGILTKEIENVLSRTQFHSQCSGKVRLVYKFVLSGEEDPEAHTSVAFNPPNEYVITSNPYGPICRLSQATVQKRSWIRRLFTGH
jgi:hypothetical protein